MCVQSGRKKKRLGVSLSPSVPSRCAYGTRVPEVRSLHPTSSIWKECRKEEEKGTATFESSSMQHVRLSCSASSPALAFALTLGPDRLLPSPHLTTTNSQPDL